MRRPGSVYTIDKPKATRPCDSNGRYIGNGVTGNESFQILNQRTEQRYTSP